MTAIIAYLMANKAIVGILGALAFAISVYFKGYFKGKSAAEKVNQEAELNAQKDVQKTEAKNQELDLQRERDAQTVRNTSAIDDLIRVWEQLQKAPDDKTKKGP